MIGKVITTWQEKVSEEQLGTLLHVGLLLLRLYSGLLMAFAHGVPKVGKLFGPGPIQWADPLGLGPTLSLTLASAAEFGGGLLIALGLATRLNTIPLMFTMLVAAFIVHADDPFQKQEFALMYFFPYLCILLMGPGKYSVDHWLAQRFGSK